MRDNRLHELRKAAGMSLAQLGQAVGSEASQIRRLETGERQMTLAWMRRLAAGLGVKPADLLLEEDVGYRPDEDETRLLALWRKLRPVEAGKLLAIAQVFAEAAEDGEDTATQSPHHAATLA